LAPLRSSHKRNGLGIVILRRNNACIVLWALSLLPSVSAAEPRVVDHSSHAWLTYFGDHPFGNSKWGAHLEGQVRRHDLGGTWQQLLLRPAVNYDVSPALTLTAGYAYARTHSYSDFSPANPATNEHRLWEQAIWRYRAGRAALNSRFRLEQRFIGSAKPGFRYENRVRMWEQVTVPISGPVYFTAYDEIWFYIKPYVSNSVFDQNRAYAAVGYRVKPAWRVEVGYMNQALLQRSGSVLESNHTLVVSLYSNARFKRQ